MKTLEHSITSSEQLTWLIEVRAASICCKLCLLFSAKFLANLDLFSEEVVFLFLLEIFSNLLLWLSKLYDARITSTALSALLSFDTFLLTALLSLTGGPYNPYTIGYILVIPISALLLGMTWTMFHTALVIASFYFLFSHHTPVHELMLHEGGGTPLHLSGMLISFAALAILIAIFQSSFSKLLSRQASKISELNEITYESEKLSAVATLAAGAAHELNTPLSSILLTAAELKLQSPDNSDIQLIESQALRCRDIVQRMRYASDIQEEIGKSTFTLGDLQTSIGAYIQCETPTAVVFSWNPDTKVTADFAGLTVSLVNLLDNALFASSGRPDPVSIGYKYSDSDHNFSVTNRGKVIPREVLERIGYPFFTTKDPGIGMGLGVYLVRLFCQRNSGNFNITCDSSNLTTATMRFK